MRNRRTQGEVVIKELNNLVNTLFEKQKEMMKLQAELLSIGREKMARELGGEIDGLQLAIDTIQQRKSMIMQGVEV